MSECTSNPVYKHGNMAEARVVFCDVLCFVKYKFGKTPLKTLRSAISDFYSGDDLSAAKQQLLNDISKIKTSAQSFRTSHDVARETTALLLAKRMTLCLCLQASMKMSCSINYQDMLVTDNLDAIPSIRLYEGDSHGIVRGGATDIKMAQQNRGAAGTRIEAQ